MTNLDKSHGTYKSYFIGFLLSVLLTLASYFAVTLAPLSTSGTYVAITVFAVAQLLVQLIFFLHLASEEKPRPHLASFVFTSIFVLIVVAGSLWVMYNMNVNMM